MRKTTNRLVARTSCRRPSCYQEAPAILLAQRKGIDQHPQRVPLWALSLSSLEETDGVHRETGLLSQRLLREAKGETMASK